MFLNAFSMIDLLSLPSGWCNAELLMSQSFVDENSFFFCISPLYFGKGVL